LIRNALLAVIPCEDFESPNDALDHYRDHRQKAVNAINIAQPRETSSAKQTP
jgi:hypothetical protein